jgi:signal transduction histidine kinase
MLMNLLSNAIKFTAARGDEPGRITVTLRRSRTAGA